MMFHWKKAVVIATAAVLALAGCTPADSGPEGSSGGTLTLGLLLPASTFSAQGASWANESPYMQAVYDGLLRAEPDGTIVPHLATEWSYSDDLTVLDLTLRDDVTFSDGTPFNADAAAQNLIRFRDGTSPNASFLVNLADAKAIDDTHLELTLSSPDPALLTYLTQNAGLQESPEAFDNPDVETVPVGSGPYTLNVDETVVGNSYVFDKNPDYWKSEDQHYDKLVMNVYTDSTSLLSAIQGGQVNVSTTSDNTTADQIEAAGYTLSPIENNWWGLIIGDRDGTLNPAIGDPRVRQAINYAFDRDAMLQAAADGRGTVTQQVFPTSSPSFDSALDDTYSYDAVKAKKLLAEAGYPDGFDLIMPSAAALGASNFTLIQQQLGDVGIRVTYEEVQVNDYINTIVTGKYAVTFMALQLDPTDWQLSQFELDKTATFNGFHNDDPTVQGHIATIQTGTAEEAEKAGKALNAYIVEQGWFAPWFRPELNTASDATTDVIVQVGNSYPYLWNIKPKA
ncbi:peptide ABC transporter substrate-binding protein [Agromyces sp. ISL-38]|uniref:ABC transporter substrate-binding protein n=1 Tax=Agromyces sp. ISL-38 TaxID=2819107 RepID=UPI001BE62693|nr:ABC transporter substrate-binding protein [Agromyces sp. ISL-38]MBT2498586.1 peptide ABC transporter substrate-binding protein [Agromyces sp. ISL-38]